MAQDDIQGQVVDGSGNPVSGAIVELTKSYQSNPTSRERVFRTTTDSNGNYIFTGHPDGDGTTQEWHVSAYSHDGTAYVNSFNNPGVTADLPSNAIPDSVIDNFEDYPDGPYDENGETLSDFYGGDLASFDRQTGTVFEGTHALEQDGDVRIASLAGEGLPRYPQEGDEFSIRVKMGSTFTRIGFGVQSRNPWRDNAYVVNSDFRSGQPSLKIRGNENGNSLFAIDGTDTTNPTNEWCRIKVNWSSGFTAELFDSSGNSIDSVSTSDTTYLSGGIGFGATTSGTRYYDAYQIV